MALARRLCRLPPRLLPLVAASKPHLAGNPSPAPALLPALSSPPPPSPSFPPLARLYSTDSGGSTPSMISVGSAESFSNIIAKVQDDKLPAVFYYTAVWCGPCRAMAPVIAKLSNKYPKIPVYKVDIDMDGVSGRLSDLKIFSVPTFHFYRQGQKTGEVVGADVKKVEAAMESLHKQQ